MALATYTDLIAAVADWLARNSITGGRADDFITLTEAKFNRELRVPQMESRAATSIAAGDAYLSVPTDMLAIRVLTHDSQPNEQLQYATPDWLRGFYRSMPGRPKHYAQFGSEWQLGPVPDINYTFEAIYWARIPGLSAENPTNWLLRDAPDVYLYGALFQASVYYRNASDISLYKSLLEEAVASLEHAGSDMSMNGSPLVTRCR